MDQGDLAPGQEVKAKFRYRIEAPVGRGGAGTVFRAHCLDAGVGDDTPPPLVALKALDLRDAREGDQRVRRELAALKAVRSPLIPRVHDVSLDPPWGFLVMDLFQHGTVRDHIKRHGPYTEAETWALLRDLLGAVRVAHSASVLHLDIKPSNVLRDGDGGHVLTDFGISQGSHADGVLRTSGLGTPGYRAPEQSAGQRERFDLRTDLYGVGATAWSALTGVRLATKRASAIVEQAEDEHGLPSASTLRPYTSEGLDAVLMKLLHRDPNRRPGSAPEALAMVDRVLGAAERVPVPGRAVGVAEAQAIIAALADPLWYLLFKQEPRGLRRLDDGEVLCAEGERSFQCYILVHGEISVFLGDVPVALEHREGTFLGEVSALTGQPRTATLKARGTAYVRALNASQLEHLVVRNPSIGVRVMRSMAERLSLNREIATGVPREG